MSAMLLARGHRLAGLAGLSGALLFFVGDMLFYGYPGPGDGFAEGLLATVRAASEQRLFAGGLVAPLAASLCIVGFWHVFPNVRAEASWAGRAMFVCFFLLMVAGSGIHMLWTAKGLALKYCSAPTAACPELLAAIRSYWSLAYELGAAPGYAGCALLAVLVLLGKTRYPRWTVLANPALLLALSPLATRLPSPLGAPLVGGSANLSIAAFFFVSTITTWETGGGRRAPPCAAMARSIAAESSATGR